MRPSTTLCWLLALSSPAFAAPGILLFPTLGRPSRLELRGVVLQHAPSGDSALARNLESLAERGMPHARLLLEAGGQALAFTADDEGRFEAALQPDKPFPIGMISVSAKIEGAEAHSTAQIVADDAPFLVISDFDDTIAVTNVVHKRQMIRSALLLDGSTQPPVPGMAALYSCLGKTSVHPPAFALVTGSPIQYAPRVQAFLEKNHFPFLGLYLRKLSSETMSNYKQPWIRKLLAEFPQPVLSFGDSGEHDPEVYRQMRAEFPGRLREVYIRRVTPTTDPHRFDELIPFDDPHEVALDAAKKGYASPECVRAAFGVVP